MPLTLSAITLAAHTLLDAFADERFPAPRWDQAVRTLAAAREQLGGSPRRLIHRLFADARTASARDLHACAAALVDYLETHGVPEPPAPPTPGGRPQQLRFFDP